MHAYYKFFVDESFDISKGFLFVFHNLSLENKIFFELIKSAVIISFP